MLPPIFLHFQLANGPHLMYFELLRLFAFGTFREYLEHKGKLPELSPVMKKKLQHLTIVSLATKMKVRLFSVLFTFSLPYFSTNSVTTCFEMGDA